MKGDYLMKNEKGAATLLEYTIVLPIAFAIVFMLIFVGFTMHQKAVMEAATQRSAIYVARTITDPSYEKIVSTDGTKDANDILSATITNESIVNAPYRYLFTGSGSISDSELSVADLIAKNQIFIDTAPNVTVNKEAGIFTKVVVTATQEYEIPKLINGLDLPSILTIETQSVVYVNQPAEFIRNADYITDIVVDVTGPIVDKITSVVSKIKFFNKNVK
jgi:hypothetical protein